MTLGISWFQNLKIRKKSSQPFFAHNNSILPEFLKKQLSPQIFSTLEIFYSFHIQLENITWQKNINVMSILTQWESLAVNPQEDPFFKEIVLSANQHQISPSLPVLMIRGRKKDWIKKKWDRFSDLVHTSSTTVGPFIEITMHLLGYPAPKLVEQAKVLAVALELTIRLKKIPLYHQSEKMIFAQEDMGLFRYDEKNYQGKKVNENLRRLVMHHTDKIRNLYEESSSLLNKIPTNTGGALTVLYHQGNTWLENIKNNWENIFDNNPPLEKRDLWPLMLQQAPYHL